MDARKAGVGTLAVVAVLLASPWAAPADLPASLPAVEPTGTWRSVDVTGGGGSLVVIDRIGGDEWNIVSHYAGPPPSPLVENMTPYVGTGRRVGPREFAYTLVSYLMQPGGRIFAVRVATGTSVAKEDGSVVNTEWLAIYTPNQDPFGSDPPAYGCFGPFVGRMVRIEMAKPCGS